ncbi:hypothetical protein B0A48_11077 [Cryoendolithus antarcticus]|uniref:U-box domain-containing protein n=1 Tax=Cryoendolithus antarcticus TaxID=1507870 RepID=A0A1V8SUS2_9PEZI|nr:hypothetical protein B0A48_11077 [Cryoendolithus antarcticus]
MADQEMTDADKIRMKRLAKLGAIPSNSAPSTSTPTPEQSKPSSPPLPQSNAAPVPASLTAAAKTESPRPQIKISPRPSSPAKRERDGSEKPRVASAAKPSESLEVWQDRMLRQVFRVTLKPEEVRDTHGHALVLLASTRDDLEQSGSPLLLNVEVVESAISEAASHAPKGQPFEYLLTCFKRISRAIRSTKYTGPEDPRHNVLAETRRLCMSYCIFAVTMPDMFGDNVPSGNVLVNHMLNDPESDSGICFDFLTEVSSRMDEDDSIKEEVVRAVEELSRQLSTKSMLGEERMYVNALRNFLRFPRIVEAITESPSFLPEGIAAQDIETASLLGPFFRLSPMQQEVASNYFSAPKTRDRGFITNAQDAIRLTLRTYQLDLFQIANTIIRAGTAPRERLLNWFALCVNKNHKKRAMRVDHKIVSSDGFMVNVTNTLDQLCDPFMDASFGKIERIDVDYLRRSPRVDITEETKINMDQKGSDEFYASKADGTSNFISELFFLTVAAHHYGTEAAQTRMGNLQKETKHLEKNLVGFEAERHKYASDPRYLTRFEAELAKMKKMIDDNWSTIHATNGVLLDDLNQARSMQFMRYVIVWLLRLASGCELPKSKLELPLPAQQSEVFKALPEYFLEDIVDNFKFITQNIPHILTPQQCEEIVQICITFLRNSEYVKNPGVKHGLVSILFYGIQPFGHYSRGVLGDILIGSPFAQKYLLRALMKFYIEAESTGSHTQFYDKFNIRYEIFQVIKCIWANTLYRENLRKEASVDTDFFVRFVNMIINDVTFCLDESFSRFVKIHDISKEIADWPVLASMDEAETERRKQREELLEENKRSAKSYMGLARESMETTILFTSTLPEAFTMPEIVQRLADMLDYNLDSLVGSKRKNLRVDNPAEYGFNPKQLLSDFMSVYINLSERETFITAIARDGRSYKPENFTEAPRLAAGLKSPEDLAAFASLASKIAVVAEADAQEEDDLGEIPEEFLDPLMAELMSDPVILPTSKNVIDRSTIKSYLLSDSKDPFNRQELKIEDVIDAVEMKAKIDAWKVERREAVRREKEGAMDVSEG